MTWQRLLLGAFGAVSIGSLLTLAGCPANLESPERFEITGSGQNTCLTQVFTKKCSQTNLCHLAGTPGGGLDLTSPNVAKRLIDVPASHADTDGGDCPAAKLVDTANPAASWLLIKLSDGVTCGTKMPQLGSITSTERQCIQDFVNAAAADAGTMAGGGSAGTGGAASGGASGAGTTGGSGGAAAGSGGTSGNAGAAGSAAGSGGASGGSAGAANGGSGGASGSAGSGGA